MPRIKNVDGPQNFVLDLDLRDNAIASLNESLRNYDRAKNGEYIAYKFCIQNLANFFELFLKYYITRSHPLLIYQKPFDPKHNKKSKTITFDDAINFLVNEDKRTLPIEFKNDLDWLKKLRYIG